MTDPQHRREAQPAKGGGEAVTVRGMSDVVRRRVAAALLVLGALVAVLAITDTGPFSDPPTTEDEVRAAVEAGLLDRGPPIDSPGGRPPGCDARVMAR